MESVIRIKQKKGCTKRLPNGDSMTVTMRFDDSCGNGHNTFSITGEIFNSRGKWECGGCLHDEIAEHFPEFKHMIPYHLCSTDGPMHYIDNTIYHASSISKDQSKWYFYLENKLIRIVNAEERHEMLIKYGTNGHFKEYPNPLAKEPNLEAARNTAIWPDASLEQLRSKEQLEKRLPELLSKFKEEILKLGFTW